MSRAFTLIIALFVLGSIAPQGIDLAGDEIGKTAETRIGTYDSRAIANAFTASRFNPTQEKKAAYEMAKAAGDREK
jgi:hypothetical protein